LRISRFTLDGKRLIVKVEVFLSYSVSILILATLNASLNNQWILSRTGNDIIDKRKIAKI